MSARDRRFRLDSGDYATVLELTGIPTEVRLSVHNPGDPIPPEYLPNLFDPLRRGPTSGSNPSSSSRANHSIGLGLDIVQNIARAHGGEVQVTSTAEAGTTFTVILPRNSGAHAAKSSGVFSIRALKAAQETARKVG